MGLPLLLAGCGAKPEAGHERAGEGGQAPVTGRVTILAAASLAEVFDELGHEFERQHPGTEVRFSFAASSTLAAQAAEGAPGDVLATADPRTMRMAVEAGVVADEPAVFARNTLVIVVPAGNPGGVGSPADLARPDLKIALCARRVPCGAASEWALDLAGISVTPVTWERDVKAVLSKVMLDEVDAGLVYATDVRAAGDRVEALSFPEARGAVNEYMIAVLRQAPNPAAAAAFAALVLSEPGRTALARAGFDVR